MKKGNWPVWLLAIAATINFAVAMALSMTDAQ